MDFLEGREVPLGSQGRKSSKEVKESSQERTQRKDLKETWKDGVPTRKSRKEVNDVKAGSQIKQ